MTRWDVDNNKEVESDCPGPANDRVRHVVVHSTQPTHRPFQRLIQQLYLVRPRNFPFSLTSVTYVGILIERLTLPYCLVLLFVVKASSVLTKRSNAFVLGVV